MSDEPSASDRAAGQLASRIHAVRFTPVRLREGYAMDDVDTLLDDLADAVTTGRAVSPLVAAARFTSVKWREGYDMGEVDQFLAGVVAEADGTAAPGTSVPTSAVPSTSPAQPAASPSVIQERPGMFARLFGAKR